MGTIIIVARTSADISLLSTSTAIEGCRDGVEVGREGVAVVGMHDGAGLGSTEGCAVEGSAEGCGVVGRYVGSYAYFAFKIP